MISVLRSGRAPLSRACNPLHLQFRVPPSGPPSPDQPDDAGGGMGAGRASLPGMLFGVAIAALVTAAATASAIDPPADRSPGVAAAPLPQKLRHAVLLDPKVSEATARACQMAHRLGLARAEGRPKISANITGSRQIVGRIKEIPRGRTVIEDGRVRTKTPHAEEMALGCAYPRIRPPREEQHL